MRVPGPRPTLDTVALAAGVSRMTVSNAYNHPEQVAATTRAKVLAAAAGLGYAGPDPTAASLRSRRTRTVGVVLTERLPYAFADPGLVTLLHGIATELSSAGNALLLVPAAGPDGHSLLHHAIVDALILCTVAGDDPAIAAALARRIPLVTVGNPRLPGVPVVGADSARATARLAEHLAGHGHRRIAIVTTLAGDASGASRPLFHHRVDSFRTALVRDGVDARTVHVLAAADNSRAAGRAAVADVMTHPRRSRVTAIFAVTDILALGALDAAAAAGVRVPRDMSIAGFDDIEAAAQARPPLTSVAHDLYGQGRAAARIALRLVAGEQVQVARTRTELIVRASTGPAPSA